MSLAQQRAPSLGSSIFARRGRATSVIHRLPMKVVVVPMGHTFCQSRRRCCGAICNQVGGAPSCANGVGNAGEVDKSMSMLAL